MKGRRLDARVPMFGGCEGCHASIAAYNAYPARSGYWRCRDCIRSSGWRDVVEANAAIFAREDDPLPRRRITVEVNGGLVENIIVPAGAEVFVIDHDTGERSVWTANGERRLASPDDDQEPDA